MTSISEWEGFIPKESASVSRKEFHGPCMVDGAGNDRFVVWPGEGEHGRYFCRQQCHGCKSKGDLIDFLRHFCGMSFSDACKRVGKTAAKKPLAWIEFKREPAFKVAKKSILKTKPTTGIKPELPETENPSMTEFKGDILTHPVNGWCYLGQEFCEHHIFFSRANIEKCSVNIDPKHGKTNLSLLKSCPLKKEGN